MPLAGFDLETTSADPFTARIVTGCILRVDGGVAVPRNYLANPGIPIPAEATAIHGYTDDYVQKHGRPHEQVVSAVACDVRATLDERRALCIYNASYDLSLLATQEPTFDVGDGLVVDPFVLDKHYDRYRKGSRKLSAVAIHYGVRLDDAHDAEADATAAARIVWKMMRRYPELASFTAAELMQKQTEWYREDAYRLIDYLRRNDRPHENVRTEWPIQRNLEAQAA